ncbi:MAG TPA: DUF6544 family protein [Mycobacteriales bacterium]|nr:DUF6544 family protein [Mycobacteriales bacterium]
MYSANPIFREHTLPEIVQNQVSRALGESELLPVRQRLYQSGEMRLSPTSPWRAFRAVHDADLVDVSFRWAARMRLAPLIWLEAVDEFDGEQGALNCRLWGRLPLLAADGDDIAIGQAMRYLAELPLTPHAILSNTQLRWHHLAQNRVEVTARVCETRVRVRLGFDASGDITTAYAPDRPRSVKGRIYRTAWQGTFGDYREISGVRVPTRAEATWQLPDGPFTYWRCAVTDLRFG